MKKETEEQRKERLFNLDIKYKGKEYKACKEYEDRQYALNKIIFVEVGDKIFIEGIEHEIAWWQMNGSNGTRVKVVGPQRLLDITTRVDSAIRDLCAADRPQKSPSCCWVIGI